MRTVIGYTRRGRPIHAIAGSDGTRPWHEVRSDLTAAEERARSLRDEGDRHLAIHGLPDGVGWDSPAAEQRAAEIMAQVTAARAAVDALRTESRAAMLRDYQAGRFQTEEAGQGNDLPWQRQRRDARPAGPGWEYRSAGLRAIEASGLTGAPADRLDRLVRDTRSDPGGLLGRYLAAVGDPHYESAFVRALADPTTGHFGMTAQEAAAMREVQEVMAQRAMAIGTDSAGGFAVPLQVDPTIVLSGDGATHPFRDIATVRSMIGPELRLVTSEGATVSYGAEGSAVSDGSPTLEQPILYAERGTGWVPFSIEYGMDVPGALNDLARVLRDARDVLDADMFANGDGHASDEPEGVLVGVTAAEQVTGVVTNIADVYELAGSLPARFQPGAVFVSAYSTLLTLRQLVGGADPDDVAVVSEDMSRILGRPWRECSTFADGILAYGDFRQGFVIGDRIGTTVEIVQHVFNGASPNLPLGQRGLFALWRTGSLVQVPNAIRTLGQDVAS